MRRVRYEVDPYNRLIMDDSGKRRGVPEFRKVLEGRLRIDEDNGLYYHIKAPLSGQHKIPNQIRLKGSWSLTDNHDLRLTLDKEARETFGDELTIGGQILDARENSLLFAVTTITKENVRSTYALDLHGSWKADEKNRLTFRIKRERGIYDILTFNGAWEIDNTHQIIYQYEKAELLRKKKNIHALVFKGRWDITEKLRISYLLSESSDSRFVFNASASVFAEEYIKYELGIGSTSRAKPLRRTVTLYGKWKIKRDIGLIFEIQYEGEKAHAIVFGADARLTDKDTISFALRDEIKNKDIGIKVELRHEILGGDGEAFVRALKDREELAIYAGAAWRW